MHTRMNKMCEKYVCDTEDVITGIQTTDEHVCSLAISTFSLIKNSAHVETDTAVRWMTSQGNSCQFGIKIKETLVIMSISLFFTFFYFFFYLKKQAFG